MALLFLVALFLAWPTTGLSLIAWVAILLGRGYLRGKAAKTRAAYLDAQASAHAAARAGSATLPTSILNPAFQKQLVVETTRAAVDAGMSAEQAKAWFSQQNVANAVMTAAASFEKEGFSRSAQIVGAADFTKDFARAHLHAANDAREEKGDHDAAHEKGKALFEQGMRHALQFRSTEAIDCYTRSIEASANPAPYINRANLFGKRIRHFEALQDLLEAKRLDEQQANEFPTEIARELEHANLVTLGYRNGFREKLIEELKDGDTHEIAGRMLCVCFGIEPGRWKYNTYDHPFVEYHFFNELDNVFRFDDRKHYPDVAEFIDAYPGDFIAMKVDACPDAQAYRDIEVKLHSLLCSYDERDMQRLRNSMLYQIHCKLLERDFGEMWMSFSSECEGVTREAAEFRLGG
ncbi:hypothetical protein AWB80_05485 [Caballeronia pedi]|uniref:Uncharacterized protein n=1 Tax=Caballeronia pedi TaxID=1777141 RepID=A0A158CM33_9BURK|nr:hypothetical protein [Caballeronia pedi]SAK83415.1 hypothetical protein AWB80_05485 [Caballeronia pedi]